MARRHLAEGTRLAAATGAWICFEDEAGQNLRPPKARTWGRRGRRPVARVCGKGSGRVSVAGLACMKPGQPSRFFFRLRLHRGRKGERRSMSEADYAALVTAAHRTLGAPVILIWDNLNTHRSAARRTLATAQASWLTIIPLPAYAPDLNPVEGAWSSMKSGLGNLAATTDDQLAGTMRKRLARIQRQPPSSRASSARPASRSNQSRRSHRPARAKPVCQDRPAWPIASARARINPR